MTLNDFQRLVAEGFNRIPVAREVLADLDTPLSTYLKLADAPVQLPAGIGAGRRKMGSLLNHRPALPQDYPGARATDHRRTRRGNRRIPDRPGPAGLDSGFSEPLPGTGHGEGLPRFIGGLVGYFRLRHHPLHRSRNWRRIRIPIRWITRIFCCWFRKTWWCSTIWPGGCT
jgi:anthranilate synthase component 1